jgi:hypothetical protein
LRIQRTISPEVPNSSTMPTHCLCHDWGGFDRDK